MDIERLSRAEGLRLIALISAHLASRDMNHQFSQEVDSYVRLATKKLAEAELASIAVQEYKMRRDREKFFDASVFGEPAWDILLDLFIRSARDQTTSITSACIASNVPPTTALRWISYLEDENLVTCETDSTDRRRRFVGLTANGKQKMRGYLSGRALGGETPLISFSKDKKERADQVEGGLE